MSLICFVTLPLRHFFFPLLHYHRPSMCGIAGILRVHPPGTPPPPPELAIPESWLDILDDSIKHRGPDGQGRFRDRAIRADGSIVDVALVHRRLSILDHAGGAQPMVSMSTSALRADPSRSLISSTSSSSSFSSAPPRDTVQQKFGGISVGSENQRTYSYQGLPLPVIFHGKPNDAVNYQTLAPAATNDTIAVVFNGCVYNHRELRKELQGLGHEFVTDHSDTEVLVHGWREWKEGICARIEGMFAFIIWDATNGQLAVARDRFGEKPLYFRHRREGPYVLAVASGCPGLNALPLGLDALATSPQADSGFDRTLNCWLRFGHASIPPLRAVGVIVPGNICFAKQQTARPGVREIRWVPGQASWRRWAPIRYPRTWHPPVDRIDELLGRAVRDRLEADVPVGCFLSGGIDSSLISLHAHRHQRDVIAYTMRMPDPRIDESATASVTARHIGLKHVILECEQRPAQDLVKAIHQLGLPFGDSSLLPTHWICRAASRAGIKVALAGDGGDELFGGYRRYTAAHLLGHLGIFRHALRLLPWLAQPDPQPDSARSSRARLVNAAIHCGYDDLLAIFPEPLMRHLGFTNPLPRSMKTALAVRRFIMDLVSPPTEWLTKSRTGHAIGRDLTTYLPEDILRKTDTASMMIPLEVRSPFLDRELSDTAMRTRISHLMPHNQRKGLLRAVARKYFPPEIVDRPKQGFAIPIGEWFRSDFGQMRQLLLDHLLSPEPFGFDSLGINAVINMNFVRQMLKEHDDAGGRSVWPWKGRDHSQRLYMLLVLSIWAKWFSRIQSPGGASSGR